MKQKSLAIAIGVNQQYVSLAGASVPLVNASRIKDNLQKHERDARASN